MFLKLVSDDQIVAKIARCEPGLVLFSHKERQTELQKQVK